MRLFLNAIVLRLSRNSHLAPDKQRRTARQHELARQLRPACRARRGVAASQHRHRHICRRRHRDRDQPR